MQEELCGFSLNALGKTAFQIMLGKMNVSTDKYYITYHYSFADHKIPFAGFLMLRSVFPCAGLRMCVLLHIKVE